MSEPDLIEKVLQRALNHARLEVHPTIGPQFVAEAQAALDAYQKIKALPEIAEHVTDKLWSGNLLNARRYTNICKIVAGIIGQELRAALRGEES